MQVTAMERGTDGTGHRRNGVTQLLAYKSQRRIL